MRKLRVPTSCQCPYCGRLPEEQTYREGAESRRLRARLAGLWYSHNRACLILLAAVLLSLNTLAWTAFWHCGERLLSVTEAAAALHYSESKVRQLVHDFQLPAEKDPRGQYWVRRAAVEDYQRKREATTNERE